MSNPAEEEAARLFSRAEKLSSHPEDVESDGTEESEDAMPEDTAGDTNGAVSNARQSSKYHIPTSASGGNTGPKGVISDARAFEQARRQRRNGQSPYANGMEDRVNEDDDEDFMRQWRNARLTQLRTGESDSKENGFDTRQYGRMDVVDAVGYLDAVEQAEKETVVVVCIYDDEVRSTICAPFVHTSNKAAQSDVSAEVEACLARIARKHTSSHFVKLHYQDAEMDVVSTPAVLAYKAGDLFANLVSIIDEIPPDQALTETTLESLLQQ